MHTHVPTVLAGLLLLVFAATPALGHAQSPPPSAGRSIAMARALYADGEVGAARRVLQDARQRSPGVRSLGRWLERLEEEAAAERAAATLALDNGVRAQSRALTERIREREAYVDDSERQVVAGTVMLVLGLVGMVIGGVVLASGTGGSSWDFSRAGLAIAGGATLGGSFVLSLTGGVWVGVAVSQIEAGTRAVRRLYDQRRDDGSIGLALTAPF